MQFFEYIVPLTVTPESNETLIAKKTIRVLDCSSSLDVNQACNMWNFNHCPNDKDYCMPFIVGDKIYFQFFAPTTRYGTTIITVFNAETHEEIVKYAPYLTTESGTDANFKAFTNIIVDTADFADINCFYIRVKAYKCFIDDPQDIEDFDQCVQDLITEGKTESEAIEICILNFCDESSIDIVYTNPYCQIECDQQSVLIEAYYPKHDCNGNYYGEFASSPSTNSYKLQTRILGEIQPTENNIETTFVNNNTRKSTRNVISHRLRGHERVPYYVVQTLANIFASKKVIIDSVEYDNAVKISKNSEQGQMWIIDETITSTCGTTDFSCE